MSFRNKIVAAAMGCLSLCATATTSFAGSELQPGISTGIPLGAPLPEGVFVITMPNYGYRDTTPGTNVGALVPAWIIWSTPWTLLGGHVMFDTVSPMVNANVHGVLNRGGFMNPFIDAQIKWDLGNGFFGGIQGGVYLPVDNELTQIGIARNFASFQGVVAFSYLKDGWNISATNIFGTGQSGDIFSAPGSYGTTWYNLDVTATKKFGKFEFGLVGFASADLDAPVPGYAKQSQIALGGLVGYDFGTLNLQLKFTRDVMEVNYGGYDTRGWANIIIPLWVAAPPKPVVAKY
ncbi:transporter [Rhodoblastus acidophilus]|uniref:Transporter n=1 Tax=Candidatus Rhodoblastus alkanivorans TaxID=2954117 RepID=A0ABS9Z474_9HYPH|nr:transporter [Candidatus Rhodoblastus alkanivorans]MCI4680372.1 transporter [Candidatus Rhodoblastus alkanivorans]MCI4682392.1 transporter [Candidatus Rhodoblastus alkanivorans]MDI4639697.1 transporter [Rhodoblastus acidophilus]